VILGGAALTRDYVEGDCRRVYGGPVLYAEDAFEGLRHMKALGAGDDHAHATRPTDPAEAPAGITVLKRGASAVALTEAGQSAWVRRSADIPAPPFWGVREFAPSVAELFDFLDTFVVIRNRWAFTQGSTSDEAFAELLRTKAEPQLAAWKERLVREPILRPRARYGYFPACADGDGLRIFGFEGREAVTRIPLPRQDAGRRLCIADFFEPESGGRLDVLPLQVVTLGQAAADFAARLYAGNDYADYFAFHGLATELTEAFAELLHARIRRELGIHGRDAANLRQLFSQGYQGSRYSFGYPACPDLEGNAPILDLLDGPSIGVTLTESFQMDPEYTTSALIAWHPQARYFAV
jgi:5-methyltetrahydrofolate--homocysteine methyltransferase